MPVAIDTVLTTAPIIANKNGGVTRCGLRRRRALQCPVMKNAWVKAHFGALQRRYTQLQQHVQQLPPRGARPLTIAGRVAGWITAEATDSVDGVPGVQFAPEAVHLGNADFSTMQVNALLARIAQTLHDRGCLRGWRHEMLDVWAEGQCVGVMERMALRPLGLLTRAVHLNAWTPAGQLWVARRAQSKLTDPGLWDTLVGGLCGAHESLEDSLSRESNEEAGLTAAHMSRRTPLHRITRLHKRIPEGMQVEDVLVSTCVLPSSVKPVNRDGEVSCIRALAPEALWRMIEDGAFTAEAELVILHGLIHDTNSNRGNV